MERHRQLILNKLKFHGNMTAVDAVSVMRRNREHNKRFAALQLCILREISKLKVTVFDEMPSHAFFSFCFITVSLSLCHCTEVSHTGGSAQCVAWCLWTG